MLDEADVVNRHHHRDFGKQWRRVLHVNQIGPISSNQPRQIPAEPGIRICGDLPDIEAFREQTGGSRNGNVGYEFRAPVDLCETSQEASDVNFVSGEVAADCGSVYGEAHQNPSVYPLTPDGSVSCKSISSFRQAVSQVYWSSKVPRPALPIRARAAGSRSSRPTSAANSPAPEGRAILTPGSASSPSAARGVATTGLAAAQASRIFMRVPLPVRMVATTT